MPLGYKSNNGFTLMELLITLSIGAILLAATAPAMRGFIQNNNLEARTFELVNDINFARSEAVKRKVNVVLCRVADPESTDPCSTGDPNIWTTGWLVFTDEDGIGVPGPTDRLLRRGASKTGLQIMADTNRLGYNPDGSTDQGDTAIFAICDERGAASGRQINVAPHGRLRLKDGRNNALTCTPTS